MPHTPPHTDTICALSTPAGEGALALIRVSGPLCEPLARAIFNAPDVRPARTARLSAYRALSGNILDRVLWTFFAENASYTGEAMLEISPHGNPFIVQKILADLVARGCRLAEPGEFTRTAFLNGRIDLSQAEAVGEVIRARTEKALKAARRQLEGALGERIRALTDDLLQILAEVEARIDFADEDLPENHEDIPTARIRALLGHMRVLAKTRDYHTLLQEGARAVILGAPNAGKSSLLNALLGEERALVSPEAGTTRDYITERWKAGPYCIQLIDTAGVRSGAGTLETAGIALALEKAATADIKLLVVDASQPFPSLPPQALKILYPDTTLLVENKTDLLPSFDESAPRASSNDSAPTPASDEAALRPFKHRVKISLKTGDNVGTLESAIVRTLESGMTIPDEDQILVSARHAAALDAATDALEQALAQWQRGTPSEFVASDLRLALDALGDIVGRPDNDALLDKLFSTFCLGK